MASREDIRSAALPLFAKQGVAQTTAAQIAEAAGVTESEVLAEFGEVRTILLRSGLYLRLLDTFLEVPAELSPSAAWVVAIEESAKDVDAVEWQNDATRQGLLASDPIVGEYAVPMAMGVIALTREVVAKRTGLPVDSPKVAAFAGAVIGPMGTMHSSEFASPAEWVAAHAAAVEGLGPSLDALLR